jgi:hypothetical protein
MICPRGGTPVTSTTLCTAICSLFPVLIIATAAYYQVADIGVVQGIRWAAAGVASGPIAYAILRPCKQRRGIDRTYTAAQIAAGDFDSEVDVRTNR